MIKRILQTIKKAVLGISNEQLSIEANIKVGLKVGKNVSGLINCTIDHGHCWLIEIGDDVIFAPQVYLLAHDTSTKKSTGYVRIGKIKIGNSCFIGARAFIMPNVVLGDGCIVGAGSIVTQSFPENSVIAGNPAKFICSVQDYEQKCKMQLEEGPLFSEDYRLGRITDHQKREMNDRIKKYGFIK